jgi:hypothetical protein
LSLSLDGGPSAGGECLGQQRERERDGKGERVERWGGREWKFRKEEREGEGERQREGREDGGKK